METRLNITESGNLMKAGFLYLVELLSERCKNSWSTTAQTLTVCVSTYANHAYRYI